MTWQSILDQVPSQPVCLEALDFAVKQLSEPILNHSLRVYLIAKWLAENEGDENLTQPESLRLIFVAALFHDMGTCDLYNGSQRFEVEGADAAKAHLKAHMISEADSQKVWVAIALHTSPGIAERIDPFTRLIRTAVKIDFSTAQQEQHKATEIVDTIEAVLPRLDIESVLADSVVRQAKKIPELAEGPFWPDSEKHPKASWPGILLKAHLENPGYEGVNPAF